MPSATSMPVDQYLAQQRERIERLRTEAALERKALDEGMAQRTTAFATDLSEQLNTTGHTSRFSRPRAPETHNNNNNAPSSVVGNSADSGPRVPNAIPESASAMSGDTVAAPPGGAGGMAGAAPPPPSVGNSFDAIQEILRTSAGAGLAAATAANGVNATSSTYTTNNQGNAAASHPFHHSSTLSRSAALGGDALRTSPARPESVFADPHLSPSRRLLPNDDDDRPAFAAPGTAGDLPEISARVARQVAGLNEMTESFSAMGRPAAPHPSMIPPGSAGIGGVGAGGGAFNPATRASHYVPSSAPVANEQDPAVVAQLREEIEQKEAQRMQIQRDARQFEVRLKEAHERITRARSELAAIAKAEDELSTDRRILEQKKSDFDAASKRFEIEQKNANAEIESSARVIAGRAGELQTEERRAVLMVGESKAQLDRVKTELVEVEGRVRLLSQQNLILEERCRNAEVEGEHERRRVREKQAMAVEQLRKEIRVREIALGSQ